MTPTARKRIIRVLRVLIAFGVAVGIGVVFTWLLLNGVALVMNGIQ